MGSVSARHRRLEHRLFAARPWHFHFYGKTPLALVTGRERTYLEHFWNDFAADPQNQYLKAIANFMRRPTPSRATWPPEWKFSGPFQRTPRSFAGFAKTKLTMPMLVLSGEKAGGPFLIEQGKMVATDVEGVLVKARTLADEEAARGGHPETGRVLDR